MTKEMLLIGGATPRMMDRFAADFDKVHELSKVDNRTTFLAEQGEGITAVATNGHDGVAPDIMKALPNLKIISGYGVGYDAIDTDTAVARGIVVTHTPNVLNDEVANTAVMMMLTLYREFLRDEAYVRAGRWHVEGNAPISRSPSNRTVGILGLGRIGETIANKLKAFDATIVYHSRNPKEVDYTYYGDLTKMAADVDVLIVITPGGSATNKLVNREVLNALGPDGTLINVSRGSVVDEAELVLALQEGRLGYAGLDVFEAEPKVPEALLTMPNVVLLPHVGSATVETRQAMGDLVCDNLTQFLKDGTTISPVPECAHL
ncbi:2-hydroxyacid dehydrogenase [Actibacterium sp. 188UL27-1]|uniref:2-hydroxyacid dehydrogenase n=1 Tax=Actibacterium sp. 188UL27-1 TaxID=2786961 RepID=UPI001957A535|nr:2-hydroxyacid dehydrogenase [Actibacterium sp. 188UL27-1]MBM7066827.1 2-hydroxyacid dehydrogenase [Actibacterium sp. 188UL27-1]